MQRLVRLSDLPQFDNARRIVSDAQEAMRNAATLTHGTVPVSATPFGIGAVKPIALHENRPARI